jgi:hypothetical protein
MAILESLPITIIGIGDIFEAVLENDRPEEKVKIVGGWKRGIITLTELKVRDANI